MFFLHYILSHLGARIHVDTAHMSSFYGVYRCLQITNCRIFANLFVDLAERSKALGLGPGFFGSAGSNFQISYLHEIPAVDTNSFFFGGACIMHPRS